MSGLAPPSGMDVELDLLLIPQAHQHRLQFIGVFLAWGHKLLDRVKRSRLVQCGNNLCFGHHRAFLACLSWAQDFLFVVVGLGTKARKRRELSTMIRRSTSSLAPAAFSFGTNTVSVFA